MLSDNARRMGPLRDKLQWVELWMHRRHLSEKLGRRVRAYYTEIWSNHKGQLVLQCIYLISVHAWLSLLFPAAAAGCAAQTKA